MLIRNWHTFHTLVWLSVPLPPPPHAGPPSPCVGHGWRTNGYFPDITDYSANAMARDAFLQQPHGCATLLKGGIIWSLAIETLGFSPALNGPLNMVYNHGVCLLGQNVPDAVQLWNDTVLLLEYSLGGQVPTRWD